MGVDALSKLYITCILAGWLAYCQLPAPCWFLAWLIFNPEDGGDTFFRNVSSHMDYMALYPRRWQHLMLFLFSYFMKLFENVVDKSRCHDTIYSSYYVSVIELII
jgi:hypothetical protein